MGGVVAVDVGGAGVEEAADVFVAHRPQGHAGGGEGGGGEAGDPPAHRRVAYGHRRGLAHFEVLAAAVDALDRPAPQGPVAAPEVGEEPHDVFVAGVGAEEQVLAPAVGVGLDGAGG